MKNSIVDFGEYSSLIRMDFQKINFVICAVHLVFLTIYLVLNVPFLFWMNLFMASLSLFYLLILKNNNFLLFYGLIFCQVTAVIIMTTTVLGWDAGVQHYLVIFPAFVFTVVRGWQKYAVVIISGVSYFGLYKWVPEATGAVSEEVMSSFYIVNIAGVLLVLVFISNLYGKTTQKILNELNDLSRIDPLTKILNRRSMYQYVNKARKKKIQSYLLLIDLDDFKNINDKWGHECGDMVLIHCAEVFRQFTKEKGRAARWGGEEFLLLLYAKNKDEALGKAEEIAETINKKRTFFYQQKEVPLSITGGMIALDPVIHTEKMINAADEALYHGKQRGKNQIVYAGSFKNNEKIDNLG
ncbi:GGDEF domain-containing protein [Alkalicoccus daliensis]|uniref:Diguanylate cyclase (GGDEF) domain-containing protein n=1 Tax=Alkalicoccus daliensis TaxID=745820 RepID=A0A1H0KC71_9BACI|nr:GGDEF domain-containing protein [Alkalicoccus daliensis]SDO53443.1 diguanylate cyclase (GGDEF) domain-containing protein [Alkalicoccus daliensis]